MTEPADVIVPPMLYLPVLEHPAGGSVAAVRSLQDGRIGLLAYTALDRLAAQCGSGQPWILVATSQVHRIREAQPFDVIAFDVVVPEDLRAGDRLRRDEVAS
jgi:hypothetical protein